MAGQRRINSVVNRVVRGSRSPATMTAMDSVSRFLGRAGFYDRHRPGYPGAVVDFLRERIGLTAGWQVADIGSGTGISSELFLRNGNPVVGVEPNQEMRHAADVRLAGYAAYRGSPATAEHTGLPAESVDLVVAATAFHWFDTPAAKREFRRILKPDGYVALMWNVRRKDTPFGAGFERLLVAHSTDYVARYANESKDSLEAIGKLFAPLPFEEASFPNSQVLDWEAAVGRTVSASYMPLPGTPQHDAFVADLRRLFETCATGGCVRLDYETKVYFGRLRQG